MSNASTGNQAVNRLLDIRFAELLTIHKGPVKRVFDNYISIPTLSEPISDWLEFILNQARCHHPHRELFNISTINLIISISNAAYLSSHQPAQHMSLSPQLIQDTLTHLDTIHGIKLKSGLLENLIQYCITFIQLDRQENRQQQQQPVNNLNYVLTWIFKQYPRFWMQSHIKQLISTELISQLKDISQCSEVVGLINEVLQLYPEPVPGECLAHPFISRIQEIKRLIIGEGLMAKLEKQIMASITRITATGLNYIVDGRNRFYTGTGIDIVALTAFVGHMNSAGSKFVVVFNAKFRRLIHTRCTAAVIHRCIFAPDGIDDDLLSIYLWLSSPMSYIITADNYNNHAAKLAGNKYLEGLWHNWLARFRVPDV
jgi:hypothetical protein